ISINPNFVEARREINALQGAAKENSSVSTSDLFTGDITNIVSQLFKKKKAKQASSKRSTGPAGTASCGKPPSAAARDFPTSCKILVSGQKYRGRRTVPAALSRIFC